MGMRIISEGNDKRYGIGMRIVRRYGMGIRVYSI